MQSNNLSKMGGCQSSCINQSNESYYENENGNCVYRKRSQNGLGVGLSVDANPFEKVINLI